MRHNLNGFKNTLKDRLVEYFISDLPSIFLDLALFLGGIWLLSLRIPGWSLFWGLILVPTGAAFTIITLDKVSRNRITPPRFETVKCRVCGKITFVKKGEKELVCGQCRKDILKGTLKERSK
jgi:hypothetical protein